MFGNLFGGEKSNEPTKREGGASRLNAEDEAINKEINIMGEGIIDDARDIIIETVNYFAEKNQGDLVERMSLKDFLDEIKKENSSYDKKIEEQIHIWINGHRGDVDFKKPVADFLSGISERIDEYEK